MSGLTRGDEGMLRGDNLLKEQGWGRARDREDREAGGGRQTRRAEQRA